MDDKLKVIRDYGNDSIKIITIDVEKIKQRPHQYIGYDGYLGFFHIIKEIIQNAIDEAMGVIGGCCDKIDIIYDQIAKEVRVSDNGRGIPKDIVEATFTTIQASGKFDSESYDRETSGENGVKIIAPYYSDIVR